MRIVSWNCQGAFRKKAKYILKMQPDIVVIQECEPLEKLSFDDELARPQIMQWFGDGKKGIGIFSYSNYNFIVDVSYNPEIRHCIPLTVTGSETFNLLAVWAMNHDIRKLRYVGQLHAALNEYTEYMAKPDVIILGDFNSNAIWDYKPRIGTHSELVRRLSEHGLVSIYHELNEQTQGNEEQNTFFLYRHEDRGYHIDYCFVPLEWMNNISKFEIGDYKTWSPHSDHCPLLIEFKEG